jgi:translation initiation factor 1
MMKKKNALSALVYSTDPDFKIGEPSPISTLPQDQQKLKVYLDKKHRAGKIVTLVAGFIGTVNDLEAIARELKNLCGTGGSVKDGLIVIQGDNKEKVFSWLTKNGFVLSKKM